MPSFCLVLSQELKGTIDLHGVKPEDINLLDDSMRGMHDWSFSIACQGRKWVLTADTESAWKAWRKNLIAVITS